MRVRIDGVVHEIDEAPQLDPKRKHRIEAVVDRFRVRPDASQRLAESFETAIRLGDGTAEVVFPDSATLPALRFSSRHACPVCGFTVPPLEPRLFSFNNPAGACPACDGLGFQEFFDPERVVVHPHLSLAGGAVRGWDRRNAHYFELLQSLARHFAFDVEQPWTELPEAIRTLLLFGSGEQQIEFRYPRGTQPDTPQACIRGHRAEPRAALPGDRVPGRARGAAQVPRHPAVPGVRRRPAQRGRTLGADRRPQPARGHAPDRGAGA